MGNRFNSLSNEDLEYLKTHTKFDEKTIKDWYRGFKMDCPDGKLTTEKFIEMYSAFFPMGNAEEFCLHVMKTFDRDGNGYVDFKEFLLGMSTASDGTPEDKLKWLFDMYDMDDDGTIDQSELVSIIQSLYEAVSGTLDPETQEGIGHTAERMMEIMDVDKDGFITKDEFIYSFMKDKELRDMMTNM